MPALLQNALVVFFLWLLATAALHKLRYPHYYAGLLRGYLGKGPLTGRPLVYLFSVLELLLAAGLCAAPLRPAAFVGIAVLLTVYLAGMSRQLAAGRRDMRCGCAGPDSDLRITPALLVRNTVLVAAALAGALPVTGAGMLFNAALCGLFLILAYLCSEQLLLNAQRFRESWG